MSVDYQEISTETLQDSSQTVYQDYLMLDRLNKLSGETAILRYKDDLVDLSIPFSFLHMWYTTVLMDSNVPKPIKLGSKDSYLIIRKSIYELIECEDSFTFSYVGGNTFSRFKKAPEEVCLGKASFSLESILGIEEGIFPEMEAVEVEMPYEKVKTRLVGATMKIHLSIPDDWIRSIVSLPFTLSGFEIKRKTVTLLGTNGLSITLKGYTGLRSYKDNVCISVIDKQKRNRDVTLCSKYYDPR
ncbi:hypothetical protein [Paenibacillus sp. 276b]|uniref:hypothetical protein n=1 Tax=Paenibacillus sp. 276b TaxID=1566277 RepID=UPI000895BE77|nr:hypothetical protein [Paenibacillus sp. 276b]SEB27647.1 hypothetical protein SAMN03159332_6324 [Paenibacillus sp. 276b]